MKGDSLRIRLEHALEEKFPDYLTINEVEEICRECHKKMSNAERRFRFDSKVPKLYISNKRVWNEKGTAIIGYEWIGEAEVLRDKTINIPVVKKIEFGGEQGQLAGIDTYRRY